MTFAMRDHGGLAFSVDEYRRRYAAALAALDALGLDVMLIRTPENITYLSGYETPGYYGYHCLVVARDQAPVLIGRFLEVSSNTQASSWLTETVYIPDDRVPEQVTAQLLVERHAAAARIGVEMGAFFFTVREYTALRDHLPGATFVDCSTAVERLRMIKSEAEVTYIREATRIADAACLAGIEACAPGRSENDVAAEVHRTWCALGAEYTGLPNFITSGPRTSICHATWRGRVLESNDYVSMEIAASRYRYAGAVYRGVTLGSPNRLARRAAAACIEALHATIEALKPGAICEDVDRIGRAVIARHGFGEHHRHRLGYSIGLNFPPDWGEGQIISIRPGEKRPLEANMTFHVVPGFLLLDEKLGHCTSATVRVTPGGAEILNTLPIILFER
jgi:Xaa-Pro dipeptidase